MKLRDGTAELNVLVSGRPITEYEHGGNVFVQGRKGSEFILQYRNHTNKRVLVIPSVDGKSTLDGKPATPDSKGYVVGPWATLDIKGWTLDNQSVASFEFSDKEASYATALEGTSAQSGVIGVLVYEEKVVELPKPVIKHVHHHHPRIDPWPSPQPWPKYPGNPPVWMGNAQNIDTTQLSAADVKTTMATRSMMSATHVNTSYQANVQTDGIASNVEQPEGAFDMGTAFGQKADMATRDVKFQRGSVVAQLVLYYDSRRNLEKRGIQVSKREDRYVSELPQAFYGTGCTPPPGWKG